MEEFISYMPVKDDYKPIEHSREENKKRILDKIEIFLAKKERHIK